MSKNKEKKTKKGFAPHAIRIGCVLLVLLLIVNVAANYFSRVLDVYVGLGEATITTKEGAETWDTEYYKLDSKTAEDADKVAKDVTLRIAEEGIVLMKNENAALPMNAGSVTLLGRRSVETVFGGTGSGAGDEGQCTRLNDALVQAGFKVNPTLIDLYKNNLDKVPVAKTTMDKAADMTYYIGEFPQTYFTDDVTASYADYSDAAILVFGRQGGEGMDFCTDLKGALESGTTAMQTSVAETANYQPGQHQLELSQEEKELLAHAEENFDKVIVVINSANVMEVGALRDDPQVDAILWMAYPGSRGTVALANILKGDVNPSGHTVDTWVVDMTADPTFPNTSPVQYKNVSKANAMGDSYVVEYEEGIYFGYRYYETVAADGGSFTVEGESGKSYEEAVAYPFGYGLSYTSFEQSIKNAKAENGKIVVTVTVKNTGEVAVNDVVQVYFHAPYIKGGVE